MADRTIRVEHDVFQLASPYVRVVLAAIGPGAETTPAVLGNRFQSAVSASVASFGSDGVDIAQIPAILPWREAFKAAGWSASKYRSSIEALLRRAARGELNTMNVPLIDAGTVATLECLVPVGVHILDDVPLGELVLGRASGFERFEALDGSFEPPDQGEIIYRCGNTVLTRRWVWRQGRIGSIFGKPRLLAVNVDIIDPSLVSIDSAVETITELLGMCDAPVVGRVDLTSEHPTGVLTGWT